MLSELIDTGDVDLVVSPAIGGIFYGYMIAYSMGTVMIFTERKSDQMELRRGFDIKKGQKDCGG
ncbi:MAG: hypothetical protein U5N58_00210 [Actinomycetota bacterium]|nr:hypothetical protein [Actinomycetota bacterium]